MDSQATTGVSGCKKGVNLSIPLNGFLKKLLEQGEPSLETQDFQFH